MRSQLFLISLFSFFVIVYSNVVPEIEKNPEEGEYFEGDILGINDDPSKGAIQIPTASWTRWPVLPGRAYGGLVPYYINASYSANHLVVIAAGLKLIEDGTRIGNNDCIKFVPRLSETHYINIINGTGCYSYVGRQSKSGPQELSLRSLPTSTSCMVSGIVAHEFIHALGSWHEQSRTDRDNFVRIETQNILAANLHNFNKYTDTVTQTLDLPYDYGSVMHYGTSSFSSNGQPTITPLQAGAVIGQRTGLSKTDIDELRKMYKCV